LHHPTGRTSAVCRTFEMTYILQIVTALQRLPCASTMKNQS
jgi:hypothetical protein